MEFDKTRALLEKYWNGDTSLEEEQWLRRFFAAHPQGALPPDLLEAAPLFRYLHAEQERQWPEADLAIPQGRPSGARVIRPWQHWMKYAAVLLIAAGIGHSIQQFREKQRQELASFSLEQDTYQDPQQAFEETRKALELLSKNLNKGTRQVEKIGYFNEATEAIRATN